MALIFYIMIVLIVAFMLLFLSEAIYRDYQMNKLIDNLKPNDQVKIDGELFYIYKACKESKTVSVYNLFHYPISIDLHRIEPVERYKTVILGSKYLPKILRIK
jgi:hypothetical protein